MGSSPLPAPIACQCHQRRSALLLTAWRLFSGGARTSVKPKTRAQGDTFASLFALFAEAIEYGSESLPFHRVWIDLL